MTVRTGDDRARERLVRFGAGPLADVELLAIVLGHGMAGRSGVEIAGALLREAGGIHGLPRASVGRLTRVPGVGAAQASRVIAAIELGRRTLCVSPAARLPLHTAEALAQLLLPRFGSHPVERFGVVMLDARHRLMAVHLISEGSLDATVAMPREVFREATIAGAAAVALFHNHPSGDPRPSQDDIELTRRLRTAGDIVGIEVTEHLILADASYYSLKRSRQF